MTDIKTIYVVETRACGCIDWEQHTYFDNQRKASAAAKDVLLAAEPGSIARVRERTIATTNKTVEVLK